MTKIRKNINVALAGVLILSSVYAVILFTQKSQSPYGHWELDQEVSKIWPLAFNFEMQDGQIIPYSEETVSDRAYSYDAIPYTKNSEGHYTLKTDNEIISLLFKPGNELYVDWTYVHSDGSKTAYHVKYIRNWARQKAPPKLYSTD